MIDAKTRETDDILRILRETIPVDGIIIDGNTSVDQAVMTGDPSCG